MLVGIGDLPETTASRCIAIRMKRKLPGETVARISDVELEDPEFFPRLRADILRFAIDYKDQIGKARPRLPDLGDRQRDNWEPLLRIAQVIDQDLAVRCLSYAAEIEVDESDEPSVFELLLFDVAEAFEWGVKERVYSRELLVTLIQDPTKQWATSRGGFRPINEADVARMLRRYGATPKTMRISGRTPAKGYEWADLQDSVQRYLPPRREPPVEPAVTP